MLNRQRAVRTEGPVALSLEPIAGPLVATAWALAEPWVRSAVERGALIETSESYKARCTAESAQLWLIVQEARVVGAGITEIYDTPKGLTCAVPVLAAVSFEEALKPLFETVEAWARTEGCVRLEGYGRPGWSRALKPYGWRPLSVVIEKDI